MLKRWRELFATAAFLAGALAASLCGSRKNGEQREKRDYTDAPAECPLPSGSVCERLAAQTLAEEREHRAKEKEFWERQLRVSRNLNRLTFFAASVGLGGLVVLFLTLLDSQRATIESNRAWLGVVASQINTLEGGSPFYFEVKIVNTGREPALRTVWNFKVYSIPYVPQSNGLSAINLGRNIVCDGLAPAPQNSGLAAFPVSSVNYVIAHKTEKKEQPMVESAIRREVSLVVDGCVSYWTDGPRHTAFRFFLRDAQDTIPAYWRMNQEASGSDAD